MGSKRQLRGFLILGVIFIVISGAFSSIVRVRSRLHFSVIPIHVAIVLGLLVGSLLTGAVLRAVWKTGKWITVLPAGLCALALCEFYILSVIGWALEIDASSLQLLNHYLRQIFRSTTPLSYYLLLVPSVVIPLLLFIPACWAMPALFRSISWAADPGGLSIFGKARTAVHGIGSLLLYSCLFLFPLRAAIHSRHFRGEPILTFWRPVRPTAGELPRTFYRRNLRPPGEDASYAVSRDPLRKNVIVIVIDDLRADRLSRFGYARETMPLFSRRLQSTPALVPAWTTSACSVSECGILALLTSRPYQRLNVGLFSLPDALQKAGYRTYFDMSGDFTFAFGGLRAAVAKHAQLFADGFSDVRYLANDDRAVLRTLDRIPDHSDTPAFFYFHLLSVHVAGVRFLQPVWTPTISNGKRAVMALRTGSAMDREILTNNYDNGIRQADDIVDRILSTLRRKGYLDRSVVVVTADHGEAFGEHGDWLHGSNLYAESIDIPLFFLDTDLGSSRTVPYATQLDVAPTVADLVGIPIPVQWEGTSLLHGVPGISTAETTSLRPIEAIIWRKPGASWKYIFDTRRNTELLFELRTDPAERINLIPKADPALLAFLRATRASAFKGNRGLERGSR